MRIMGKWWQGEFIGGLFFYFFFNMVKEVPECVSEKELECGSTLFVNNICMCILCCYECILYIYIYDVFQLANYTQFTAKYDSVYWFAKSKALIIHPS